MTYTLSKSMNDVGEAFFSSPIDPTDVMRDWGRSDDDQRHRLVINGTVNTPMAPATTLVGALSHGFQVSGMLQSTRRCRSTSSPAWPTCRGRPSRPLADGRRRRRTSTCAPSTFIPRNAGTGSDFFTLNLRVSRTFRLGDRSSRSRRLVEAFNVTNRVNNLTRNTTWGPGRIRDNPVSTFNRITAVGDPRTLQFGARITF